MVASAHSSPWIWPLRLLRPIGQRLIAVLCRVGEVLGRWPCWLLAGCLIGAAPMLLARSCGLATSQVLTGSLLLPCVLAAALRDWAGRGLLIMAVTFVVHNAVFIGGYFLDPVGLPGAFPAGEAYWQETRAWLITGVSREYDPNYWLAAPPICCPLAESVSSPTPLSARFPTFMAFMRST